jgi:hypothetical protein
MINAMSLNDGCEPSRDGSPTRRGLDPTCGTGRFMIDALVHDDGIMMHGVDLDLWLLRVAKINIRLLSKWTSLRVKNPDDRMKPLRQARALLDQLANAEEITKVPQEDKTDGTTILLGGRAIFIHGDALLVDLEYSSNWLCAGWAWTPQQWQGNLKIRGFYGCYDHWVEAGRPALDEKQPTEVQFDYSMTEKKTPTLP